MRALFAALLVLLCASQARAQQASSLYAGITYPGHSGFCSPLCVGVKASWIVPAVTFDTGGVAVSGAQSMATWIGIQNGGSLAQLGTISTANAGSSPVYDSFYEEAPDTTIQQGLITSSLPVSPGDRITASAHCTTNCTSGTAGQTWALAMTNDTTGVTWSLSPTGWHIGLGRVYFSTEFLSATPNFGANHFSNLMVDQGSGYVPVTFTTTDMMEYNNYSGTTRWSSASILNGKGEFDICFSNTQTGGTTPPPACPIGPYRGTARVGAP
jgi:hypothetical protein